MYMIFSEETAILYKKIESYIVDYDTKKGEYVFKEGTPDEIFSDYNRFHELVVNEWDENFDYNLNA